MGIGERHELGCGLDGWNKWEAGWMVERDRMSGIVVVGDDMILVVSWLVTEESSPSTHIQ